MTPTMAIQGQHYMITRFAGTPEVSGLDGDDGPAVSAQLNYPGAVFLASSGVVYIADTNNNVVRRVQNDIITTLGAGYYSPASPAQEPTSEVSSQPTMQPTKPLSQQVYCYVGDLSVSRPVRTQMTDTVNNVCAVRTLRLC